MPPSDLAAELTAGGFNVVSVGNADRPYTTTTVLHDPAYDESGRTLGAAITGSTVSEDISLGQHADRSIVGADSPTVVHVAGQRLDQHARADRVARDPLGRPEHLLVRAPAAVG